LKRHSFEYLLQQIKTGNMKISANLLLLLSLLITGEINAAKPKVYDVTTWEFIFSLSDVSLTDEFSAQYPNAEITKSNVRFTPFFNVGEYWNFDFGDHIGFYSGFGIKNIGLITDERLPDLVGSDLLVDYKIVRRLYTGGIPLAFKIGSFKENLYFFAGGEYEFAIHYKEKYWSDTQSRSGSKTKYREWFGKQTPLTMPSLFAGVQLPGGFNIKFKYYLDNFLNNDYVKGNNNVAGQPYDISDLTRYKQSSVYYISISWQLVTEDFKSKSSKENTQIAMN
jgi:hypothetical protein